jgi:hypothetical protein
MIDSEKTITKVLAGLRDAEAPSGMERRILAAVEERTAERKSATPRWAWRAAFAAMTIACLLIATMAIYRQGNTTTQRHYLDDQPLSANRVGAGVQKAVLSPHEKVVPARTITSARKIRPANAADADLLREMRAPSHPAPTASLTDEEKLLLRVVHLGDPQVMAMLNPEVRARQEEENEAEFRKFADSTGNEETE